MRSIYDVVTKYPGALVIIDKAKPEQAVKSVTNDIDNVLEDLRGIYGSLDSYKIMYRDSQGIYDGISHSGNRFSGFFSLNERNEEAAYLRLMNPRPKTITEE